MSQSSILLQGGTLLIHDAGNHIVPTVADLLVEDSLISRISKDAITPAPNTKVVDCRGKIVSPGFVDTHRHLWQTQYKGWHSNHSITEYMPRGNFGGALWSAEDLFWGQLSGALESIEAGTTTLVDHSSCNTTPQHTQAAIQALLSAGLRTIYCYTAPRRVKTRDPWVIEDDQFSEATVSNFQTLARAGPFGNGRVHMGFAIDNIYAPAEVIKPFYADLRDPAKGRAKLITTHTVGGVMAGAAPSPAEILNSHGLLGPDILFSHANSPHDGDAALYQSTGTCVSSTPNTELQMGRFPVALLDDHYENASIGVDCHSWGVAGIPGQMRLLLQAARAERGERLAAKGMWSRRTGFTAEQVFNLGTLGGAKASGLQGEIGSLKEGMKADIVVFDSETPAMLAAAAEDPVAAIVLHSSPSDIELVLIDGVVRKEGGKLVPVSVAAAPDESKSQVEVGTKLAWKDIATKVLDSRKALKLKAEGIDFDDGEETCINMFFLDRKTMVETK